MKIAKIEIEIDGQIFHPTMKWRIESPKTFDEFGEINPKPQKPNTIMFVDPKTGKYITIKAADVPFEKIITRDKFKEVKGGVRLRKKTIKKKGKPPTERLGPEGKTIERRKVEVSKGKPKVPEGVPKEVTPPESLTKKVEPKQFESKSGALKILRGLRKEQKAASAAGAFKTSNRLRKEIEFLESKHPELKPKKRKGQDASRQADRRREKPMIDDQLAFGNPEISNQTTVTASKLPDEFQSSLETFEVVKRTKDATFVNVKNDPYSEPFELPKGTEVHIDSPKSQFIDPAEPQLFSGKAESVKPTVKVRERGYSFSGG